MLICACSEANCDECPKYKRTKPDKTYCIPQWDKPDVSRDAKDDDENSK